MSDACTPPDLTADCVLMRLRPARPTDTWAEGAVLYETAAVRTEPEDLRPLEGVLAHATRLGVDGVLLGGHLPDPGPSGAARALVELLRRADLQGQKVVVSLAPPRGTVRDLGVDELVRRATAVAEAGAHGVDLGRLEPSERGTDLLRRLLADLRARRGARFVTTAATREAALDTVLEGFDPAALPFLRHDRLARAAWDGHALRTALASTVRWAGAKDAPLVWSLDAADRRPPVGPSEPGDDEAARRRRAAASLALLALPGTVLLRQGEEVATLAPTPDRPHAETAALVAEAVAAQEEVPDSPFEVHRRALSLRREEDLGAGSLSWVDVPGLPAATTLAFLNRSVLSLTNMGPALEVTVPGDALVHSSAPVAQRGTLLTLPRDTTIWLRIG